jgi:prepilin-type N-terminal cleavage/methylation domain-containing protein
MRKKSFTLIELIVVIAIIAVLAAIIAPNVSKAIEKAKISQAITDFKAYKAAIGALYADTGHWIADDTISGSTYFLLNPGRTPLDTNPVNLADWNGTNWFGWDGPYVEKVKPVHPWGGQYGIGWWTSWGRGPQVELWLEFENACYVSGIEQCSASKESLEKIDKTIDDGNQATGEFIYVLDDGPYYDAHWIMFWDYR